MTSTPTEPGRTPHPEDPAEGADAPDAAAPDERTPHPEEPAEG